MSDVRQLFISDFDPLVDIMAKAYPGIKIVSPEDKRRMKQQLTKQREDPTINFYGLYREGKLLGGMRFNDFTLTLRSVPVMAGGVGMVGVDLLHKKEKVAKEMLTYFLNHYHQAGATMALLYPFRPDFYKKMGFGYGTKMSQYKVKPSAILHRALLPGQSKRDLHYLTQSDKTLLNQCYDRVRQKTNGLLNKSAYELENIFENRNNIIVGYKPGRQVTGYLVFKFKAAKTENFLRNHIVVSELIYEDRDALTALMTFLYSQADQIDSIFFNSQNENFHHLFFDPRNGTNHLNMLFHETNIQGVGIMYRVIDIRRAFAELQEINFGSYTGNLKITLSDSFFPHNDGSFIVNFLDGFPQVVNQDNFEVEIILDVAEFSSLLTGSITFKELYDYRLADISDTNYLDTVNRIFYAEQKPVCTTLF